MNLQSKKVAVMDDCPNKKTNGIPMVKLGELLDRVRNPVELETNRSYREIGVRSHGKGIFHKKETNAKKIGNKSVFWVEPGCFVANIVFAWEQAVAKTTEKEKGFIASHRFPMFRPKPQLLDLDYLLYFFKSARGKYLLSVASPGGAGRNKTLGQKEFLNLEIPLPPLAEQKRIAAILSTWDTAIEIQSRFLNTQSTLKKGVLSRIFSQQFEERPCIRLDKLAEIKLSNVDKKSHSNEIQTSLCNYMDVYRNNTIHKKLTFMEATASSAEIEKFQLKLGDVLLTKDSERADDIGISAVVIEPINGVVCGYHLALIRIIDKSISGQFIHYLLQSPQAKKHFFSKSKGVTRFSLGRNEIGSLLICVPEKKIQDKIFQLLKSIDDQVELSRDLIHQLREEKKWLAASLHNGQIARRI